MEIWQWAEQHWFDLLQTVGIVSGFAFTAYELRKEDRSRKISNLIAIKAENREIWKEVYNRPQLARVLETDVDLTKEPISIEEHLFVKLLILHLDTVHRMMKTKMFVKLEGLQKDVAEFFSAPIPRAIWEKMKPLQDDDFVKFVEQHLQAN
jgi:hypothetical protein